MYQITKEQCQESIDKRGEIVCCSCGGKLEPIETVNNSGTPTFWVGCNNCQIFDNGTTPKIYQTAVEMVDVNDLRAYSFDEKPNKEKYPNDFDYWRKSQIKGAVRIVSDIIKIYGLG